MGRALAGMGERERDCQIERRMADASNVPPPAPDDSLVSDGRKVVD